MDVSTRKLRYFVAVAEELNFSRAAARLYVAQQALSKQVRELEDSLGTELLRRTTRRVELTSAGETFLESARRTLAIFDSGVMTTQQQGRSEAGTLKLGFMIGAALELTIPITTEFTARWPEVRVDLREFAFDDPSAGLADDATDVALLRVPIELSDLQFEPLFVEPLMLMLPSNHRLADRASLTVGEILDEPLAVGRSSDPAWRAFWTLQKYRDGKTAQVVAKTASQTELLEIVASGHASAVTVAGAARYTQHPGVRHVLIDDAGGATLGIGWRRPSRLVELFVKTAEEVRDRETATVAGIEHPWPP